MAATLHRHEEIHTAIETWMDSYRESSYHDFYDQKLKIFGRHSVVVEDGRASDAGNLAWALRSADIRYRILTAFEKSASLHMNITKSGARYSSNNPYVGVWLITMAKTRLDGWQIVTLAETGEPFEQKDDDIVGESIDEDYAETMWHRRDRYGEKAEAKRLQRQQAQREKRAERREKEEQRLQKNSQQRENRRRRKERMRWEQEERSQLRG